MKRTSSNALVIGAFAIALVALILGIVIGSKLTRNRMIAEADRIKQARV